MNETLMRLRLLTGTLSLFPYLLLFERLNRLERKERELECARWEDDGGARLTVSTVEGERVNE